MTSKTKIIFDNTGKEMITCPCCKRNLFSCEEAHNVFIICPKCKKKVFVENAILGSVSVKYSVVTE